MSAWAQAGLVALALLLASSPSISATASEDSDFHVDSSQAEDYRGTIEEVESKITDELAIKLRQFDEWTVEGENQADAAGARNPPRGASPGTEGTDASPGQRADSTTSDGTTNGERGDADEKLASKSQSTRVGSEDATTSTTTSTASTEGDKPPHDSPQPPATADKPSKEDDVARMIREAAEQETDPDRKRALMEQYDAYIQNQ